MVGKIIDYVYLMHTRRKHITPPAPYQELDDWLAVVSWGAYPTPTPANDERAAYAVTYGLLKDFT